MVARPCVQLLDLEGARQLRPNRRGCRLRRPRGELADARQRLQLALVGLVDVEHRARACRAERRHAHAWRAEPTNVVHVEGRQLSTDGLCDKAVPRGSDGGSGASSSVIGCRDHDKHLIGCCDRLARRRADPSS